LRVNTTPYEFRSIDEIIDQFNNRNVDGIFGDSVRLFAIQDLSRASGLPWQIVDEEYSRTPLAFALPRNDLRFRLWLDWTLQDMYFDGTYQSLYRQYFPGGGEPLVMLTWTGDGAWLVPQ
jgi:ABC-type amino acid transport substrate-binding protein